MKNWIPHSTRDGSFTFFSETFNETFHSKQGARTEAIEKFAIATHLPQLAQASRHTPIRILDVCYGLGFNTAAALETIWQLNPDCPVELYGLELDASVPQAAIAPEIIQCWSKPVQKVLRALAASHAFSEKSAGGLAGSLPLQAELLIGDARQSILDLHQRAVVADAIFLDPFSPRRCPQLWTVDFLELVIQCLALRGRLATYSRSASVRAALLEAGFTIGTMPLPRQDPQHPHEWSQGTIAVSEAAGLCGMSGGVSGGVSESWLTPLSQLELEHLQTRAGIPLRDPSLKSDAATILARQRQEQEHCDRESTSSWRRRWGLDD